MNRFGATITKNLLGNGRRGAHGIKMRHLRYSWAGSSRLRHDRVS
jgi:hypothetical protein